MRSEPSGCGLIIVFALAVIAFAIIRPFGFIKVCLELFWIILKPFLGMIFNSYTALFWIVVAIIVVIFFILFDR